jgi:hypothetical protein
MHDVVAVALITAGSGLAGGTLTYLSARRQADRQAATERARLETELERLRTEREEPHFKHRQTVYHDLLNILAQWHTAMSTGSLGTILERTQWLQECESRFNAVLLFGSMRVYGTMRRLKDAVEHGMGGGDYEDDFQAAYQAAVLAMRADTAPEAPAS